MEDKYRIFRKNLRILRASKGMTGKELSEALKFKSIKRINDLEDDNRGMPKLDEIIAISNFFNITMDQLIQKEATVEVKFK